MLYNNIKGIAAHQPTIFNEMSEKESGRKIMNKQTPTTERTKQNIVEAFLVLYKTKRIEKITVREITHQAGYNRGTFYEYFRDVYDVLEYIQTQSLPTLGELPPFIAREDDSTPFITAFMNLFREKYKYYDVLLGDNGDPAFQRKLKNSLKASLIPAISKKSSVNMVEIDLMLEYILSGLIAILIYTFQNKPDLSEEQLVSMIYGLMKGDMLEKLQEWIV
jgi:AcrR family transcriptional regulator